MITLYQFPPYFGLPNASPFCLKLETYLRLAKIPYEVKAILNPGSAPKQKLPFIKDGNEVIADSGIIIDYLKAKYGNSLDEHLTREEVALTLTMQRMLEEHLYWVIVYSRWIDEPGWKIIKKEFFGKMPPIVKSIVPAMIRKKIRKAALAHGMGRHNQKEVYLLGKNDLVAIVELLGSKKFMFGDKPSSIDACLYGFLMNILYTPIASPLQSCANEHPELKTYCERVKQVAYPG